jgi:peptidoglycan/LPS O-acetylase OafA/YrhL
MRQQGTSFIDYFIKFNLWNLPATTFLVFYLARYNSAFGRLLSTRAALVGGEASYSIYLLHLWVVVRLTGPERAFSAWTALEWLTRFSIYVLFSCAIAYGTYHLIEVPSRRWIRQAYARFQARRTAPTPATAAGLAND